MSRLTKKEEWKDEVGEQHHYYSSDNACLEKLGKLEDLLEKYGISDSVNFDYLEKCIQDHDKYGELQEQIGCPLEVVWWLMQDKPILVLNPIDKSLQEIEHPLNFYNPTYQTFDITCDFFETTYKKRIWTTGGVVLPLKDYKKNFWLRKDKSE